MKSRSIKSFELKVQEYNDQSKDIFSLIDLNLKFIKLQHQSIYKNKNEISQSLIQQFQNIKKLNQECLTLRMDLLITQQISSQQIELRKQRLSQYQQKIHEQIKMIFDKEQNFKNLVTLKRKKPMYMSTEQYQAYKIDLDIKQNSKFSFQLDQQIKLYKKFNELSKIENETLKIEKQNLLKQKLNISHKIQKVKEKLKKPEKYRNFMNNQKFNIPSLCFKQKDIMSYKFDYQYNKKLKSKDPKIINLNLIRDIQRQNLDLLKKLNQQIQMTQYLQQENKHLIQKYQLQNKIMIGKPKNRNKSNLKFSQFLEQDANNETASL